MAGSRVEKVGSVFSRVTGLLRSGAMKWEDRPLWYDVYAAHPPTVQPQWNRRLPLELDDQHSPVMPLIFKEDVLRARYYKESKLKELKMEVINLRDQEDRSRCDKFIERFKAEMAEQSKKEGSEKVDADTLFKLLIEAEIQLNKPSETETVDESSELNQTPPDKP